MERRCFGIMAGNNKEKKQSNDSSIVAKRKYIIDEEQPQIDNIDVTFDPNTPKSVLKNSMQREAATSMNLSKNTIKMRRFKVDQMEDFANEYSISQTEPSVWSSILNIFNVVLITIALAIAFLVAFGLLFGLRVCAVVTNSMEPTINQGDLVIAKPIDPEDIQIGDILSYVKQDGVTYIHRVSEMEINTTDPSQTILLMSGDNVDEWGDRVDRVGAFTVQGIYVIALPGMGNFLLWVRTNWILTIAIVVTIIIFLALLKHFVDKAHNKKVMAEYLAQRRVLDKRQERKFRAYKRQKEAEDFDELLKGKKED